MHTVVFTAANVSDVSATAELLHGKEAKLWSNAGDVGVDERTAMHVPLNKNEPMYTRKRQLARQHHRENAR